jgi:hypothetical protein
MTIGQTPSPVNSFNIMVSDMTNLRRSVIVDLIMVQVISLAIGCFLILAFEGHRMNSNQISYTIAFLFITFMMIGVVYRKLASA